MKNLILFLAVGLLLSSCAEKQPEPEKLFTVAGKNVQFTNAYTFVHYDAVNRMLEAVKAERDKRLKVATTTAQRNEITLAYGAQIKELQSKASLAEYVLMLCGPDIKVDHNGGNLRSVTGKGDFILLYLWSSKDRLSSGGYLVNGKNEFSMEYGVYSLGADLVKETEKQGGEIKSGNLFITQPKGVFEIEIKAPGISGEYTGAVQFLRDQNYQI